MTRILKKLPAPVRFIACSSLVAGVAWLAGISPASAVGTRHFVLEKGKDFESGELGSTAVDSQGRLRPGLVKSLLPTTEAPAVWAALETDGSLLLATGNEGKLLRLSGSEVKLVADSEALALTGLVKAFGKVIVASMPGNTLYELRGDKLEVFAKLDGADGIYSLAFDEKTKALFAGTGPDGKVFRVTETGSSQVYFDSEEGHIVSLAAQNGVLYAGGSGKGRLYRVTAPGRANVLHDFEGTEVRAVACSSSGEVFAIANELSAAGRGEGPSGTRPMGPSSGSAQKGKGWLYRFGPGGEAEELLSRSDEHFVSLSLDEAGRPLVGTGGEGKLILVEPNHVSTVLLDLDVRQIAYARLTQNKGYVIGSDPISVATVSGLGGQASSWTSKVLDAGIPARFGAVRVDAEGEVVLSTRSGNTEEPDATWSDFQPLRAGNVVESPKARYLQLRVQLGAGGETLLRSLEIPFVTENLRAIVTDIEAETNVKSRDSRGLAKSGGPRSEKASPNLKVSFKTSNPDNDELRYFVEYQLAGTKDWFDALDPGQVLSDDKFTWNTENLPEGRYRLRVTATDELSNPPGRVTRHALEGTTFLVDNSAPIIGESSVQGRLLRFKVSDRVGPLERVEVRIEGQVTWYPVEPSDGIFDEASEEFSVDLSPLVKEGPAIFTLRAFDSAGNSEVSHVRLGK